MRFFYSYKMTVNRIYSLFKKNPRAITDSRKVVEKSLFFALKGENFDGNKFAGEALKKGAAYAIIDDEKFEGISNTILVDDVLNTLQQLAFHHRKELGIPILAITGSNGKTTTKELIASVLSKKFRICSTRGNLNNHIGVPLTLLEMTPETQFGIVEMGANHPGEIGFLASVADPDYGIITNIGRAHIEGFGSFEAVKKTKAELYDYLKLKEGTVFYNRNNPILKELTNGMKHLVSYGTERADLNGTPVQAPPYLHAIINFQEEETYIESKLIGDYNFENIMAAACIGYFFGVKPQQVQDAVKNYYPNNNRSQLIEKNQLKIIMDAYNANPTSMQASIQSFNSSFSGPKYLILGDMLELGDEIQNEHAAILEQIKKHPFDEVFLVGPDFSEAAVNENFKTFQSTAELCSYLEKINLKGSVLIKGSRAIQLEKVLDFL